MASDIGQVGGNFVNIDNIYSVKELGTRDKINGLSERRVRLRGGGTENVLTVERDDTVIFVLCTWQ